MIKPNKVLSSDSKQALRTALDNAEHIAICGHARPDGDCLGSCLAMGAYCESLGKSVTYHAPSIGSHGITFFEKVEAFSEEIQDHTQYDLFLCVDTGNIERTTLAEFPLDTIASKLFVIDHHHGNQFSHGTILLDGTTSSSCELVAELLDEHGFDLSQNNGLIANYLLTGILTDTGNFSRGLQPAKTMHVAASLIEYGADKDWLIDKLFRQESFDKIKEIGSLLGRIQRKGNLIRSTFTTSELEKAGIQDSGLGHLLYTMQKIDHDGAFVLFKIADTDDQPAIKMSRRARKPHVDVCAIAQVYGGGGHLKAAGAKVFIQGDPEEMITRIVAQANEIIDQQRLAYSA